MPPCPAPDTCWLYLVRHGATDNNRARPSRLQGRRTDPGLSAEGLEQARQTGRFLADCRFDALYCSPLLRARQTAEAIAQPHGLSIRVVDELTEVDVGQWEGRAWDEVERTDPEAYRAFMADPATHGYLGGELLRSGNLREDAYGGSAANRARMIAETVREVKGRFPDFVVGTRVSLFEGVRGGCGTAEPFDVIEDLSDILSVLSHITGAGADFINVSAGIPAIHPQLTRPENTCLFNLYHHFRYAKRVVDRFPDVAVIGSAYSAGKETAVEWAAENIERGYVHFAGFGRQNLADPDFARKVLAADSDIDRCILCGGCSRLLRKQERVRCIQYDRGDG